MHAVVATDGLKTVALHERVSRMTAQRILVRAEHTAIVEAFEFRITRQLKGLCCLAETESYDGYPTDQ